MYNKPTRCNFGSNVFINNCRYALHAPSCRAYLQLLINTILPKLHLVGSLYVIDL